MKRKLRPLWVPESVHHRIKVDAAQAGCSMTDYLLKKFEDTPFKEDAKDARRRFRGVF